MGLWRVGRFIFYIHVVTMHNRLSWVFFGHFLFLFIKSYMHINNDDTFSDVFKLSIIEARTTAMLPDAVLCYCG